MEEFKMKKYVNMINAVVILGIVIVGFLIYLAGDSYLSFREERYTEYEYAQQQKQDKYAERLSSKHARFDEQYNQR